MSKHEVKPELRSASGGTVVPQLSSADAPSASPALAHDPLTNDPYAWIDRYAADLHVAARDLARNGEARRVSDEAVAQLLTAAVRLYYAKTDLEDRTIPAIVPEASDPMTATEVLTTVSEILRAVRLGPMELGLWFRRRPDQPG